MVTMPSAGASTVSCATLAIAPSAPLVTDICGRNLTVSAPVISPDPVCAGTKTYTYTYTDCTGKYYTWVYTYTISAPVVTMPPAGASTVSCVTLAVEPAAPSITDNCGRNLNVSAPTISPDPLCGGIKTYTYTYTNCTGQNYSWIYTYTVTPPVLSITCPLTQVLCEAPSKLYTIPPVIASDNCSSNLTITFRITGATSRIGTGNDASGIFNPGLSTITWTAISACGNSSLCTSTISINSVAAPKAKIIQPTCILPEGMITVTTPAEGSGFSYSIDGGTTWDKIASFTGLVPSNYYLIVKETATGCISPPTLVTINTIPDTPNGIKTIVSDATCGIANGSVSLGIVTGGTSPYSYSFESGAFTSTVAYNGLPADIYNIVVKDSNGCTFSASATVNNINGPTAIATKVTDASCGNDNGTLTLGFVSDGTAPYSYSIDDGIFTPYLTYSGLTAGIHTIEVKDANGCILHSPATVNKIPVPTAALSGNATICDGSTHRLSITLTGTAPWDITYTDGTKSYSLTNIVSSPYLFEVSPSVNTTYTLTTVSDANCKGTVSGSANIKVSQQIIPSFDVIAPLCRNSVPPLLSGTSTNGIKGTWSPTTISTSTVGTETFTFTPDTDQCAKTITKNITVVDLLTPMFTQIGSICKNSSPPVLPATSTNGIKGKWSPSTISSVTAGTAIYTFTPDPGQCSASATMNITIDDLINPIFTQILSLCQNSVPPVFPATSTNGINGKWSPATISTTTIGSASYTFTPDAGQCSLGTKMVINTNKQNIPLFTTIGTLYQNTTPPILPTTSINGIGGTWSPSTISTATAGKTTYTFTPTDPCGTIVTIIVSVEIKAVIAGATLIGACQQAQLDASKSIGNIVKYEWSLLGQGGVLTRQSGIYTEFLLSPD